MPNDELTGRAAELKHKIIHLYNKSPSLENQLDHCCDLLCKRYPDDKYEELEKGVFKAYQAMKDQYRIFISYKRVEHAAAATKLHRVVEGLGAGRVNAFLDTSSIPYGSDWLAQLRRDSGECHAMIVLVPHLEEPSQWSTMEFTIFNEMMVPGDRLIAIYHPQGQVPSLLGRFQALPAESNRLEELLKQLLIKEDAAPGLPPINPRCSDLIEEQAIQISQRFVEPDLIERPTLNFVRLRLPQPGPVTGRDTLLKARVTASKGMDVMFKLNGPTADSLETVIDAAGGLDVHGFWLEELCSAVERASEGKVPNPTFATLAQDQDCTRTYRPALRAMFEDEQSQTYGVDIVFPEILGARLGDPGELEVLRTALRLTTRIRWEILERYLPLTSGEHIEEIKRLLRRAEREAEVNGLMDPEMLANRFSGSARERVLKMFEEYSTYRNPDGNGRLDIAFKRRNRGEVEGCLNEIKNLNREFMLLGVKQYAELVEEHW